MFDYTTDHDPGNPVAEQSNSQPSDETALDIRALGLPPSGPGDAEVDIELLRGVPKQFAIDSEDSANWLIRKILAARQYAQRVKEWAGQEQRRAEREEQCLLYLFERQLSIWARAQIDNLKGRRKSVNLPSGIVGFRSVNPSLHVDNDDAVIRWAKSHCPSAVITVPRLSRTELKAHFEATGEIPDEGAHVDPGGERFYIR